MSTKEMVWSSDFIRIFNPNKTSGQGKHTSLVESAYAITQYKLTIKTVTVNLFGIVLMSEGSKRTFGRFESTTGT